MHVAVSPKEAEAGEKTDECFEIARFLHKSADTKFVGLVNLFPGHRAGVHHHWDMFVDRMFFKPSQNSKAIQDRHPMIENDDTWFAGRTVAEPAFAFQTIQDFLTIASHDQLVL